MKRDMDLVRDILVAIEGDFLTFGGSNLHSRFGALPSVVIEHIHLMEQAGLLEVASRSLAGAVHVRGLTWEGHDFLDTVRDLEVWRRMKDGASKMGGWTFGLLKDLGTAHLKHVAKERLGLDL